MPIKTTEDVGRNNKKLIYEVVRRYSRLCNFSMKEFKDDNSVLSTAGKVKNQASMSNIVCISRMCAYKFMVTEIYSERRYSRWINKELPRLKWSFLSRTSCNVDQTLYRQSNDGLCKTPLVEAELFTLSFSIFSSQSFIPFYCTSEQSETLCSICTSLCQHSASSLAKTQITPLIRSSPLTPTVPSLRFQDLVKCEHICVHTPLYLLSRCSYAQQAPIFPVNAFPNIPIKITSRNTLLAACPMSAFNSLSGWVYI